MEKFAFERYYRSSDEIKHETVAIKARDKVDARVKIKREYPNSIKFVLLS